MKQQQWGPANQTDASVHRLPSSSSHETLRMENEGVAPITPQTPVSVVIVEASEVTTMVPEHEEVTAAPEKDGQEPVATATALPASQTPGGVLAFQAGAVCMRHCCISP